MLQPKLTKVEPLADMKLHLHYETGEIKLFDVTGYAHGAWFQILRDPGYFQSVHLIPDGSGIEWRDGQDIAPHELYEFGVPQNHPTIT